MQIKRGDDLALTGPLTVNGAPPPPGQWLPFAELRDAAGQAVATQPACAWADEMTGVVRVTLVRSKTQAMAAGQYLLALRLERVTDGYTVTTNSAPLRVTER